ncbi:penicillin-binding protein, partial [Patescibacteria group bacterium]|nr:penicillin-binding protein [Patescibacteria group bacterium]
KYGKVNLTTAKRQPGSTVKAITYSAALIKGFTAASVIDDSPIAFRSEGSVYSPVNYDKRYHGKVTIRKALANSINIPAVKMLSQIGIEEMVGLAKKMGVKDWKDSDSYGLSITLGAAETKMTDLATVYGTLANEGRKVELNPILNITDFKGSLIEEKKESVSGNEVIPAEVAFIISDILADNRARSMAFGTNSPLNIPGYRVSVKTGTTDNLRDNWAIGYTPSLLVSVWVGNNNNESMNGIASGITGATPIWNQIMTTLLKGAPREKVSVPEGIVPRLCYGQTEYFIKGNDNFKCPTSSKSANLVNRQP